MAKIKFSDDNEIIYLVDKNGMILVEMSRSWFEMVRPFNGKKPTYQEIRSVLNSYYQALSGEPQIKSGEISSRNKGRNKSYSHHF